MNLCKTCKYWIRGGNFQWENGIFGNLPTKHGKVIGEGSSGKIILCEDLSLKTGICIHTKINSDYVKEWMNRDGVEINDGICSSCDEDRSHLEIGEDFGCIHHEEMS